MDADLQAKVESALGVTISKQMAYEGKPGCTNPLCRTMCGEDGSLVCVGWHCPQCHEPTSMYGHDCGDNRG